MCSKMLRISRCRGWCTDPLRAPRSLFILACNFIVAIARLRVRFQSRRYIGITEKGSCQGWKKQHYYKNLGWQHSLLTGKIGTTVGLQFYGCLKPRHDLLKLWHYSISTPHKACVDTEMLQFLYIHRVKTL